MHAEPFFRSNSPLALNWHRNLILPFARKKISAGPKKVMLLSVILKAVFF
jgi:hypothetical protein